MWPELSSYVKYEWDRPHIGVRKMASKRLSQTVYLDSDQIKFLGDQAHENFSNVSTEIRRAIRERMNRESEV